MSCSWLWPWYTLLCLVLVLLCFIFLASFLSQKIKYCFCFSLITGHQSLILDPRSSNINPWSLIIKHRSDHQFIDHRSLIDMLMIYHHSTEIDNIDRSPRLPIRNGSEYHHRSEHTWILSHWHQKLNLVKRNINTFKQKS